MPFIDFCNEYYEDVPIFKQLTVRHTPEVFSYFLQDLGNIVFLNTTSKTSINKYGKTGMLILPQNASEIQIESLKVLAEEIDDYHISCFYDLDLQDGLVVGSELHSFSENDKPINMILTTLSLTTGKSK